MTTIKSDFDFLNIDDDADIDVDENWDNPNPFFLPMDGSPYKYFKTKLLSAECSDFFVMCLVDNFKSNQKNKNKINLFYDPDSDISELHGQSKLVTIIKVPFFLVNIQSVRFGLIKINNSHLEKFNHKEYDFSGKTSFVYMMLSSTETCVSKWICNYNKQDTLDKFIKQKLFISYNNLSDPVTENALIRHITNVSDFAYWENKANCNLGINVAFGNRKLNLRIKWKLPVVEIEKIEKEFALLDLNKLVSDKSTKKIPELGPIKGCKVKIPQSNNIVRIDRDTNEPYPNGMGCGKEEKPNILKTNIYVDASKSDKLSYFQVSSPEDRIISQDSVRELLTSHSLTRKEKYYLVSNLLVSKNYSHYILNDINVLSQLDDIFKQYKPIFRYLLSYAFINLYKEESIKKTRATTESRHVFTIDVASKLPVFPFVINNPHLNPYFTLLLSKEMLNTHINIGSIKSKFAHQAGIVDLPEFKKRLNIFMTGNSSCNLLNGATWSNMVVTGGSMAGIIPKINPLMALFKHDITDNSNPSEVTFTDKELDRYFDEYYSESDIDIACNHTNFFDFIDHVKELKEVIIKNGEIKDSDIQIAPIKTVCIYIDTDILKVKCNNGEIPFKFEYLINNKTSLDVKHYFYEIYLEEKKKSNIYNKIVLGDKINDPLYYIILDYSHIDDISLVFRDRVDKVEFGNRTIEYKPINTDTDTDIGMDRSSHSSDIDTNIDIVTKTISGIKMFHILDKNMSDISELPVDKMENVFIKTMDNIKYKIISKELKHSFEVFRIDYPDFFSTISRFHFPCVRSYYNGTTCYMTASAITAYMTMTNIEYKFFSGSQDPISIIQKYRQRGYTTYFNRKEINQIVAYTLTNDKYKKQYGITNINDGINMLGYFDHTNKFFTPKLDMSRSYCGAPGLTYNTETSDLVNYYTTLYPKYNSDLITKPVIDSNGNVIPIQRWMIDMAYDTL